MKPPTDQPSEQVMRYFTPLLYQLFNSPEDEEADRADEAWERAIRAYNERLDAIRDKMPSTVVRLSELCLHDGEILSRVEEIQPAGSILANLLDAIPMWSAVAIVSVKKDEDVYSLIYFLSDRMKAHPAPEDWAFSKLREHWLYDEVDCPSERRGPFVHRILLSTGVVLEIPFASVIIHQFPLPTKGREGLSKQSAQ